MLGTNINAFSPVVLGRKCLISRSVINASIKITINDKHYLLGKYLLLLSKDAAPSRVCLV